MPLVHEPVEVGAEDPPIGALRVDAMRDLGRRDSEVDAAGSMRPGSQRDPQYRLSRRRDLRPYLRTSIRAGDDGLWAREEARIARDRRQEAPADTATPDPRHGLSRPRVVRVEPVDPDGGDERRSDPPERDPPTRVTCDGPAVRLERRVRDDVGVVQALSPGKCREA